MRKGDIIICTRTPNDFYEKLLKVGNQYEIIYTDSLPSGLRLSGSEKVWFNIRANVILQSQFYFPILICLSKQNIST
jgi:hypothetical protein